MLKNPLHVYGDDTLQIPCHVHLGKHMLQTFAECSENVALLDADNGKSMTFGEVAQMAVDVALSLYQLGVRKGDTVSICSEKRLEYIPTITGITCTGAKFLPADVIARNKHFLYRLDMIKPRIIFCSPYAYDIHKETLKSAKYVEKIILYGDSKYELDFKEFLCHHSSHSSFEEFGPAPVQGWMDTAYILFSSGTTGWPKAVPLTHYNLIMCFNNCINSWSSTYKSKRMLCTREWFYSYGLLDSVASLMAGVTLVFTEKNTVQDYFQAISKYKINILQAVPATINEMLKTTLVGDIDLSSLEHIKSASTSIDSDLISAAKKRFTNMQNIFQFYGMTEVAGLTTLYLDRKGFKMGTVGVVCSGTVLKVVDLVTGSPVGANQRGEICFTSYALMTGYIGDAETEDQEGKYDDEGFFKTGDIGYYDDDQYIYVVDRIKNMIKYRGASLSPVEIESFLRTHPAVLDAGVTTKATEYDEAPVAFVVLQRGAVATEKEIVEYVDTNMPAISLTGGVRFVKKLPRGANEKLDRKALKEAS